MFRLRGSLHNFRVFVVEKSTNTDYRHTALHQITLASGESVKGIAQASGRTLAFLQLRQPDDLARFGRRRRFQAEFADNADDTLDQFHVVGEPPLE